MFVHLYSNCNNEMYFMAHECSSTRLLIILCMHFETFLFQKVLKDVYDNSKRSSELSSGCNQLYFIRLRQVWLGLECLHIIWHTDSSPTNYRLLLLILLYSCTIINALHVKNSFIFTYLRYERHVWFRFKWMPDWK